MRYTKEMLEPVVAASLSVAEVMRKLGLMSRGGQSHTHMRDAIDRFGIDRSHFRTGGHATGLLRKKHWSELLKDGRRLDSKTIRRALIESGRPYLCEECNEKPVWCGKPLTLHTDHKDGNHTNCLPTNLRFLCPNCHSQTETYAKIKCPTAKRCACGNRAVSGMCRSCYCQSRSKNVPDIAMLRELIWQHPTTVIAKAFGVSDKAVSKWCEKYGLSKPGRGYWKKHAGKM